MLMRFPSYFSIHVCMCLCLCVCRYTTVGYFSIHNALLRRIRFRVFDFCLRLSQYALVNVCTREYERVHYSGQMFVAVRVYTSAVFFSLPDTFYVTFVPVMSRWCLVARLLNYMCCMQQHKKKNRVFLVFYAARSLWFGLLAIQFSTPTLAKLSRIRESLFSLTILLHFCLYP